MEELLKDTLIKVITKKLVEEAVKKAAFLAIGPVNFILKELTFKLVSYIVEAGFMELSIAIYGFKVDREVSEIHSILDKISTAQSDEEIIQYEKQLEEASYRFISFKS